MEPVEIGAAPLITLKGLMAEWREVMAAIDDAQGELTPEIEQRMALLDVSIPEKIDAWAYVMERMEAEHEFWKARRKVDHEVELKYERHLEFAKTRLKGIMFEMGVVEMRGHDAKFQTVNSRARLTIQDENLIPAKYLTERFVYDIDKDKLRADIEAGIEVEGVRLEKVTALRRSVNSTKALEPKKTKVTK